MSVEKIVVSCGLGKVESDALLNRAKYELAVITGQYPAYRKAKRSISGFKIRRKMVNGILVTLRRKSMENFLRKLVWLTFPRFRNFYGFVPKINGRTFSFGVSDVGVMTEAASEAFQVVRGFNVSVVLEREAPVNEQLEKLRAVGFPVKQQRV